MISVRSNYIHIAFPIFQFFKKKKKLFYCMVMVVGCPKYLVIYKKLLFVHD